MVTNMQQGKTGVAKQVQLDRDIRVMVERELFELERVLPAASLKGKEIGTGYLFVWCLNDVCSSMYFLFNHIPEGKDSVDEKESK